MKGFKKLGVICVATTLFTSSVMGVSAGSLKDIFNAEYYAEKYADVKAAYGNNEEALYEHYLNYGLKEGRSASALFDVADYRAKYSDLQNEFGDNWTAYAEHYLTYGLNEGRDGGGEFDAVSYANRYADLKEAFGYDITALYEHYKTYGEKENRDARSQAEIDAQNAASGIGNVNSDKGGSTVQPEVTATPAPEATATPVPEATATPAPEATATPVPEATATPAPEATATPIPEATATPAPEATATPVPEATATPVPEVTTTPAPEATKIPVEVDLNGLAQAYSRYLLMDCIEVTTTFGLFDITGDGIPELFSGEGCDIVTYWQDDYWFMFADMVKNEWYYDEETKEPGCYYYYDYNGVEEYLWFCTIDTTTSEYPYEWLELNWDRKITENIDLTQYTYINIHEYNKEANISSSVMAQTLKAWMEAQEEYEYTYK